MQFVKVAAAVLNQTPLDWEGNQRRIVQAIEMARTAGASIVCLPELCITGYGCEDAFLSPGIHATSLAVLNEILPATRGLVVSLGLPVYYCGAVFNAACLAVDGKLLGFVGKQNLAGEGIHYEPRWFKPWPPGVRVDYLSDDLRIPLGDLRIPLGDLMFDVGGIRLGFEICEDAWVADRPGADLAQRGCDILLNPSASHFAFGKSEIRTRFVLEGSRAFSVGYVYANLLGNEAGRIVYDGDAMIASCGKLLAIGPRFSYADQVVTTATLDVQTIRMNRARTGSFRPLVEHTPHRVISSPFLYPDLAGHAPSDRATASNVAAVNGEGAATVLPSTPHVADPTPRQRELPRTDDTPALLDWEKSGCIKEEEFTRAVALALYDYLRRSRSHGFVVSLSGGADSATVSVLVAKMVEFGLQELGSDAFLAKLAYIRDLPATGDEKAIVRRLLTTVYQATRNSSATTRNAAHAVAEGIGATFLEFDVDRVVQGYTQLVSEGIGRELSWQRDDIALQNIQARVRSPSVWMLANLTGALLLSTSNRSEAAVGYATMDGDTSGGLSPIAGIDKAYLRHWLRWMENSGPRGASPIPALRAVNVQAPTAELRPATSKQTDEDDLMPYEVLDAIERAAIRDKKMPLECLLVIEPQFPARDRQLLASWVDRFFKLWCRNQWKRERYAPSFHLDDENLDPKTWCRFPILSGGFTRELAEMWSAVNKGPTSK
jgi:NAD+ synthase (glutamine-hydrolysing)